MRGHVRRKKNADGKPIGSWSYVLDMGPQDLQVCQDCGRRQWVEGGRELKACPKCGGELVMREDRRQVECSRDATGNPLRTKKEAEAALAKVLGSIDDGVWIAPKNLSLREYLREHYLPLVEAQALAPSTKTAHKTIVNRHLIPGLRGYSLRQLTKPAIRRFYQELLESGRQDGSKGKPLSSGSVRRIHAVLHCALNQAVDDGLIVRNPSDGATHKLLASNSRRLAEDKAWTLAQMQTFLSHTAALYDDYAGRLETDPQGKRTAADPAARLHPLWHLLLFSALRRGEACGLRWDDLDTEAGCVNVRRALVPVGGDVIERTTLKTEDSAGAVYVDGLTMAVLERHRAVQRRERLKAGPAWSASGYLFTDPDGSALNPRWVSRLFVRAIDEVNKRLAEDDCEPLPRISMHGTRHTHISVGLSHGQSLAVMSERARHKKVGITKDVYGHLEKTTHRQAAEAFAEIVTATTQPRA